MEKRNSFHSLGKVIALIAMCLCTSVPVLFAEEEQNDVCVEGRILLIFAKGIKTWQQTKGDGELLPSSMQILYDEKILQYSPNETLPKSNRRVNIPQFVCIFDMIGKNIQADDLPDNMPIVWTIGRVQKNEKGELCHVAVLLSEELRLYSEKEFKTIMKDKILPFVKEQKGKE